MAVYKNLLFPLLARFDAEAVHNIAVKLLELAQRRSLGRYLLKTAVGPLDDKPVDLFGLNFPNPIGVAAGFDKDARIPDALGLLGFGHIEVGTITPLPQKGNEKPRLFRFPEDGALINRMGFPNRGVAFAADKLLALNNHERNYILGLSIGKQKETPLEEASNDYTTIMERTYALVDYFAINISSPNTPRLRELQGRRLLGELLESLQRTSAAIAEKEQISTRPLLLKISPDLSDGEIDYLLDSALSARVSGIIATNTTVDNAGLYNRRGHEGGGVSGRPLGKKSNRIIARIHKVTNGALPIIGVGGVFNAEDVRQKMDAGATLVELYTGFIYEGPSIVRTIMRQL